MVPAWRGPNDPAMTSIAAGNEAMTIKTHERSLSPDVSWLLPEPAIDYASAALSVMSTKKITASAALEAVAAAPQTPWPAARSSFESAAANQSRWRTHIPKMTAAIRIRV
jgi:hypothetical protein